jgi:hypothetical protein
MVEEVEVQQYSAKDRDGFTLNNSSSSSSVSEMGIIPGRFNFFKTSYVLSSKAKTYNLKSSQTAAKDWYKASPRDR